MGYRGKVDQQNQARDRGLDLDGAVEFWSVLTAIPPGQFVKPYRAVPDPSIRRSKHPMGCPAEVYSCSRTHRSVMGMIDALLSCSGSEELG